jgi:hypothetical protein
MNNNHVKIKCNICHQTFTPGVDGVFFAPGPGCDKCLGIKRDPTGAPWFPREVEHLVTNLSTGKVEVVTREQAFGSNAFKAAFPAKAR